MSIRLAFAHDKLSSEVFLADLSRFILNPMINSDLLNAAEIEQFHVVWVPSGLVSYWCQKCTREIITITTQIHALRLDTI